MATSACSSTSPSSTSATTMPEPAPSADLGHDHAGHDHDGHDHDGRGPHPDPIARRERRLLIVLLLNLGIVAAQAIVGLLAHSLGLVADAGHSLTDLAAAA